MSRRDVLSIWQTFTLCVIGTMGMASADSSPQGADLERVRTVVGGYLAAWQKGDYTSMPQYWDAASRRQVRADQVVNAFEVASPGTEEQKARMRNAWGVDYLITGRPSKIVDFRVRLLSDGRAVADAIAEFSPGSENGTDVLFLSPGFMEEFQKQGPNDNGTKALVMAMALKAMLEGSEVNTAKGQSKTIYGVGGPPYIALHFRRYTLVREDGDWRIANAVTISDMPIAAEQAKSSGLRQGKERLASNGQTTVKRTGRKQESTQIEQYIKVATCQIPQAALCIARIGWVKIRCSALRAGSRSGTRSRRSSDGG